MAWIETRLLFLFLGAIALVVSSGAPSHADLYGGAEVIDGNTLLVGGQRVRLYGIDAPELAQTCEGPKQVIQCGMMSRSAVRELLAAVERVACETRGRDQDGHWIAICYADESDIGRSLVHAGWALANRRQSLDYVRTEHRAKNAKRGMWRGEFDPPWVWRSLNR